MENQVILALKNNKLLKNSQFDDLNLENIKGQLLTKSEGEILFRESEDAESLYLIVSGEINLLKKQESQKTESSVFGENDFFGADEFFQQGKRISTAVALRDSYIISLSKLEVDNLIGQNDVILNNIYESVNKDEAAAPTTVNEQPADESPSDISLEGFEDIKITEGLGSDSVEDPIIEQPVQQTDDSIGTNDGAVSDENLSISLDDIPSSDTTGITGENLSLDEGLDSNTGLSSEDISFNESGSNPGHGDSTPELMPENELSPDSAPAEDNTSEKIDSPDAEESTPVVEKELEKSAPVVQRTKINDSKNFELLEKINDAAQILNSNIKIDDLLQTIVKVATDLTNCDRGTLYLMEKEKNELWSKIAMGSESKEIKLKVGEGIAGWVAEKGETINLENAQEDDRFNVSFDKTSGYETKSMICFPIKNRNRDIVGVLQLLNSKNGKFSEIDEELLEALSIHAAMALQNAELVEQLLKGERVTSLGKMANFLIQDIKKPIMVSKRYTEHLKSKELPEETAKVVDMLHDQLDHIAELVNSTSSYSEGQIVLRSHIANLNEMLEDFVTRIGTFVSSRNCNIKSEFDKNVIVNVSEKQMYQAFQHLVKNACDAMPDGGEINLLTEKVEKNVTITIKDSGLGIPESLHEKIFEPFTSHEKKEGTGLGLAITRKIIEEHDGTITVTSEIGEGAQFIITLPIASK